MIATSDKPQRSTSDAIKAFVPIFGWLPEYQKGWLRPDIIAALTLGALLVPEAMAYAGIAAALGFLIVSLVLQFGFGWEVGRPVPGRYSVITIMHWGNFAAALDGGTAMGVTLVRGRKEMEDSEPGNMQAKSSDLAPAANKPASSYDAGK